ncbi:MAG: hypothetical protein JWM77_3228 [Rhodospirillales bacterium]|jgi:hypothetical protein|nr:hypothetical protein [Rhodospirillales bacterium]
MMLRLAVATAAFVSISQAAFAGIPVPPVSVPEPTTLAILGAGVAGLVIAKLRNRK